MTKKSSESGFNLEREIERFAAYLRDKQARQDWLNDSFYDPESFKSKLDSIERKLDGAVNDLIEVTTHFRFGRMDRFSHCDSRLSKSLSDAQDAVAAVRISKREVSILHSRTRAQELQRSAVKLAYSLVGRISTRQVRGVAVRIMDKAGIHPPDASTITEWRKEIENENSNVK